MKVVFLFATFFLVSIISLGQIENERVQINDSIFNKDHKLVTFKRNIEKDWNFQFKDSKMIISCKDSIWLMYFNAANRSVVDTTEKLFNDTSYIMKNGQRILPKMTFLLVTKWTRKMKQDAGKFNHDLYQQVLILKKKYHLEHLQEWHKWGDSGFIGAIDHDEKNINAFYNEKVNLEAKRIKIPSCASTNYSIFIEQQNWVNELPYMISKYYPKEKLANIDQMVEDLLQVHGGEDE